jgi:hypothetical protein
MYRQRPRVRTLAAVCTLAGAALISLFLSFRLGSPPSLAQPHSLPPPSPGRNAQTAALQRLTNDAASTPLVWTPEGRRILIQRPGQTLPRQQLFELWAVDLDTGTERRLAENAVSPSVHGARVAYLCFLEQDHWEAREVDLAGGPAKRLGAARWNLPPAWIGDDVTYLAPSGRLATLDSLLPPLPQDRARALLSPDGRSMAVVNGGRLWIENAQGPITLAQAAFIGGLAWSPAGDRLAYILSQDGPMPELWVWNAASRQSSQLAQAELEHWGAPSWSPDGGTLAFTRRPTGSGGNATGDIWLIGADGKDLHPLALTRQDEYAPLWSPDGQKLAFARDGDVWVADLGAPELRTAMEADQQPADLQAAERLRAAAPPVSVSTGDGGRATPLGLTAPLTIWVMHDAANNTCRSVPHGQIDAYPFEQYVKQVVPYEVPALWPTATLQAQSVAARTYAWRKALDRPYPAYSYTVKDSTADQYMCDETHPRTNQAVDATEGQYISYQGNVIYAFFCAETGTPTNYRDEFKGIPYLRPVDDPVSLGRARHGHSWGMSQWGAHRWANDHGWNYVQILCHYYTSAAIERSGDITAPLAALTLPWPDFYVRTDYAHLRANASAAVSVTMAARTQMTGTWTIIHSDDHPADGWDYVWPVAAYTDTFTPSLELQVTAYDGAGGQVSSDISAVGLHRTPPHGTLSLSATDVLTTAMGFTSSEVTTIHVSLHLTAVDTLPVSGTIQVSLANDDRIWEDHALYRTAGETVADSAAGDGSAWHIGAGTQGVLYGPYTTLLSPGQRYRAFFRLKVPPPALTSALELVKVDVALDGGSELLGVRYLRGTDWKAGDTYQDFAVDFEVPTRGGEVEFRTDFDGAFDLWVDRVGIASAPVDVSSPLSWTLPARHGPVTTTAWLVDRAGNVSEPAILTATVVDNQPPGPWKEFRCAELSCTVQVRDAIAGLDIDRAAYRHSNDGGLSWSPWLSATCTGSRGSHDWETIAAGVPTTVVPDETRLQFRAYDMAAAANEGLSPIYALPSRVFLPLVQRPSSSLEQHVN